MIPFNLARKFHKEKNDFEAIAFFERVVLTYPDSVYAIYAAYYIAQIHASNYEKLYNSYIEKTADYRQEQCEKNSPIIPVQLFAEAALQEELMHQQLNQTILAYARVTEKYPESFQCQLTHRDLASLYLKIDKTELAKQEYASLITLTGEFSNSILGYQAQEKLSQIK